MFNRCGGVFIVGSVIELKKQITYVHFGCVFPQKFQSITFLLNASIVRLILY